MSASREPNKQQMDAIEYVGDKPLLIRAGPGAGKTFVLIERIKHLLNNTDAKPESFLIITFTRKAANELRERLSDEEDGIPINEINKMHISTIHGFCSKILSEFGKSGYILLDDDNNERRKMFLRRYRKQLGFIEEAYIGGSGLEKVMKKFDEYSTFDVKIEELQKHIREKCPISQRYLDFIDSYKDGDKFDFPYEEVKNDDELNESYYNAQYIAVAEAYPKYLKLLEENNYMDFTLMQKKLLELLDNDPSIAKNSRFKNILIDEFQDTDPIQMRIFDHFLGNYEHEQSSSNSYQGNFQTFTVVGDDDQSIYGFRGSNSKFFTNFKDNYNAEVVTLENNYRSGPEIVDFNESFMNTVDKTRDKKLHAHKNNQNACVYSMNFPAWRGNEQQAQKIVDLVKYLKSSGKIQRYSEIGLLFRSITSTVVNILSDKFTEENIGFDLVSNEGLSDRDEVRALITLFWYLRKIGDKYIPSKWEKNWLNLDAFSNPYLNLSKTTTDALSRIQSEYETKVIELANELQPKYIEEKKIKEIVEYSKVFHYKIPDELRKELFETIGRPLELSLLNKDELLELGVTPEDYSNLFEKLNEMKKELYSDKKGKDTLIKTYYKLINLIGIIGDKFENSTDENKIILKNIASLSTTIANYEEIVYKHDITGLFWFMTSALDNYPSAVIQDMEKDSVQIMTIHKSKGLEFPVVIVGNISKNFPKELDPISQAEEYADKTNDYYTPLEFLDFKYFDNRQEEVESENLEQNRVLYVAMSRAKRLLVLLYSIKKSGEIAPVIDKIMKTTELPELTEAELENLPVIDEKPPVIDDNIEISFSSYSKYKDCPHCYDVEYNYGFKQSNDDYLRDGLITHSILEQLHQRKIQGQEITHETIDFIIERTVKNNQNIDSESTKFKNIKEGIYRYWDNYGSQWDILASEYEFYDIRKGYTLTGIIDLIIREGDNIKIIDFKTTSKPTFKDTKTKYLEQLSMYAMALKEDPEYENYNINSGMIYTILNKEDNLHHYNLDEKQLNEMEQKIELVVKNIKEENFKERCNKSDCPACNLF